MKLISSLYQERVYKVSTERRREREREKKWCLNYFRNAISVILEVKKGEREGENKTQFVYLQRSGFKERKREKKTFQIDRELE